MVQQRESASLGVSGGFLGLVELSVTEDRDAESLLLYRFLIKRLHFSQFIPVCVFIFVSRQ